MDLLGDGYRGVMCFIIETHAGFKRQGGTETGSWLGAGKVKNKNNPWNIIRNERSTTCWIKIDFF